MMTFYLLDVAPCGSTGTLEAIETSRILSSPNYPAAAGPNLRCRWLIDGNSSTVQIHFQHLSIGPADSAQCSGDRLEVQDVINVIFATEFYFLLFRSKNDENLFV